MKRYHRKWNMFLFAVYSAIMLWLLFDRVGGIDGMPYWDQVRANLNLEPFHTIKLFLNVLDSRIYSASAIINLGGNVILFIPLGFFLPRVFPGLRKFHRTLLATVLIISAVELTQLFTLLGCCDIDDLILNVTGATLGYILHKTTK